MNKFEDLSIGVIIAFTIIVLFVITNSKKNNFDYYPILDVDGDGHVSRDELKQFMSVYEQNKSCVNQLDLYKKIKTGVLRGVLFGMVLNDFEGGMVLSLMLGLVNPLLCFSDVIF